MKFLFPLCAVLSTTHWWGLYLRLYVRLYKPNVHWLCSEGGNNFVLCGSMDFYDMAVTLTYSWLPYPPDWRFWYSDPNTLSCFFAPSPWKGTISELYVPRQHWLWGVFFLIITPGLTLARIQSTTALEMISHIFTSHELCDLLPAAPFTHSLDALTPLDMAIFISDYISWFCKWGFNVHVPVRGDIRLNFLRKLALHLLFLKSWSALQHTDFKVDYFSERPIISEG